MGLSSKVVSNNEGFAFEYNWTTPPPPPPTSLKQPPPKPSPAKRRQPSSQNESEPLNCPRCDSIDTKFCYYNNYNKSQPRHYCKSCKRHWTKGGTLRNVPIGGGRKNKRQKTSAAAAAAAHSDGPVFLGPSWADGRSNNFQGDSNVQLPLSSSSSFYGWLGGKATEESIVTTVEPTDTGGGFAGDLEAPVASLWSWDDIETLISTNTSGFEINAQF